MALESQRAVEVFTKLGSDDLLLRRMTGTEQIGRLYEYQLDLYSEDQDIKPEDLLGSKMTVRLEVINGGNRWFDGYCTAFSHMNRSGGYGYFQYQATIRPWLWFLTRTSDCKIFQEKSIPDIVKDVFRSHGFTDFEDKLTGDYPSCEYVVQYRETDFNFVSRLMEEHGFYYYFKHANNLHTLVLADSSSAHETYPEYDSLPYYPLDESALRERDHLYDWSVVKQVQPGVTVLNEFDFKNPRTDLLKTRIKSLNHEHPTSEEEIYDYPGGYNNVHTRGESLVQARLEELHAQHHKVESAGTARGLGSGFLFSLRDYPREDQNRQYLIESVSHEINSDEFVSSNLSESGELYTCHLVALDAECAYRAPRLTPKPVVQGPQTATVVGPASEEIHVDEYGRIKVQFHWDRYGTSDENSSCWMRVAQFWAGKKWGAQFIPRIGHEVVVDFLEGDPDQPLVTGCVYNADNMPPYDLPANKTQSGIKTRSSKGGGPNDYNEIRFEDKKDAEQIYVHAEKNLDTVVENKETRRIYNTRTTSVGSSDNKRPSEIIEDTTVYGARETKIVGNDDLLVSEAPNGRFVQIADADHMLQVDKGGNFIKILQGDDEKRVELGKSTTEAMQSIELKVGANSIKIDQMGITLKGIQIKVEASALLSTKGAIVQHSADGPMMITGAVVLIN